ncbi:MAG: YgiT-type zinc finger protein [Acidobacteria bacterium]|nr:YgiT-type zinc finger protein [Acidobacteriota bacterium]
MFKCSACGFTESVDHPVQEVFFIDGRHVLVEEIPARVCTRCGEPSFSPETVEKIRRMIHEHIPPLRTIPLDVFRCA